MTCCINSLEKHDIWNKEGLRKNKAKAFTQSVLRQHQGNLVLEQWYMVSSF